MTITRNFIPKYQCPAKLREIWLTIYDTQLVILLIYRKNAILLNILVQHAHIQVGEGVTRT